MIHTSFTCRKYLYRHHCNHLNIPHYCSPHRSLNSHNTCLDPEIIHNLNIAANRKAAIRHSHAVTYRSGHSNLHYWNPRAPNSHETRQQEHCSKERTYNQVLKLVICYNLLSNSVPRFATHGTSPSARSKAAKRDTKGTDTNPSVIIPNPHIDTSYNAYNSNSVPTSIASCFNCLLYKANANNQIYWQPYMITLQEQENKNLQPTAPSPSNQQRNISPDSLNKSHKNTRYNTSKTHFTSTIVNTNYCSTNIACRIHYTFYHCSNIFLLQECLLTDNNCQNHTKNANQTEISTFLQENKKGDATDHKLCVKIHHPNSRARPGEDSKQQHGQALIGRINQPRNQAQKFHTNVAVQH